MNNTQVAHLWANQSKESAKGSNLFFEGRKIYSYGRHFCIANIVREYSGYNKAIILYNSGKYSVSTAKHQSYVTRAINKDMQRVFCVPCVDFDERFDSDTKEAHEKNLNHFARQIAENLDSAQTSRKASEWLVSNAKGIQGEALDYIEVFKLGKKYKTAFENSVVISDKVTAKIEQQREKAKAIEAKKEVERLARIEILKTDLSAWLNGEFHSSYIHELGIYLRVKGEWVETSLGATVSLKAAKTLFNLIKSGKDIKGFVIDGFTVLGINGVLTIGCHKIERTEINRFAGLQGWGQIEIH